MPAQTTDKFTYVGTPGTATTLAAPGYTSGVSTSMTVGSTTNWPSASDSKVYFAVDRAQVVDGTETRIAGTYCEFEGIVSDATTISSVTKTYGNAQDYPAGSLTRVYIPVSSSRENALIDGLAVEHNLDGTHNLPSGSIVSGKLADDAVTTAKIADNSVTTAKIENDAITAVKIDFSTLFLGKTAITSGSAATSQTVKCTLSTTIPAGVTSVKLTASFEVVSSGTQTITIRIRRGTDTSGTLLATRQVFVSAATATEEVNLIGFDDSVSAGAQSYVVTVQAASSGATITSGGVFFAEVVS